MDVGGDADVRIAGGRACGANQHTSLDVAVSGGRSVGHQLELQSLLHEQFAFSVCMADQRSGDFADQHQRDQYALSTGGGADAGAILFLCASHQQLLGFADDVPTSHGRRPRRCRSRTSRSARGNESICQFPAQHFKSDRLAESGSAPDKSPARWNNSKAPRENLWKRPRELTRRLRRALRVSRPISQRTSSPRRSFNRLAPKLRPIYPPPMRHPPERRKASAQPNPKPRPAGASRPAATLLRRDKSPQNRGEMDMAGGPLHERARIVEGRLQKQTNETAAHLSGIHEIVGRLLELTEASVFEGGEKLRALEQRLAQLEMRYSVNRNSP